VTRGSYAANVGAIIAKAQINNGGKVILYQPENEYRCAARGRTYGSKEQQQLMMRDSVSRTLIGFNFPDPGYMQYVEDQARRAGVVVPFMNNDAWSAGHNAPGTGVGQVDIYGHDLAPLDPDCDDMAWEKGALRETQYANHLNVSASTPYAIPDVSNFPIAQSRFRIERVANLRSSKYVGLLRLEFLHHC
jgi:hypothetical protein